MNSCGRHGRFWFRRSARCSLRSADAHHDWLTVIQLPAHAPDLNPVEGVWSVVKNDLGNLATHGADHLARCHRATDSSAFSTAPGSTLASSPRPVWPSPPNP